MRKGGYIECSLVGREIGGILSLTHGSSMKARERSKTTQENRLVEPSGALERKKEAVGSPRNPFLNKTKEIFIRFSFCCT